jgi:hypothetical protein
LETSNTLNVSRAGLGDPVELKLRKTVFGGTENTESANGQTFRRDDSFAD